MKWKLLFYLLLFTFIAALYDMATVPDHLALKITVATSMVLFIADIINLFAAYCVAYNKRPIRSYRFWWMALLVFVISNVYIQIQAFIQFWIGYTVDEMIVQSIIALFVLFISSLPMLKLIDEEAKTKVGV